MSHRPRPSAGTPSPVRRSLASVSVVAPFRPALLVLAALAFAVLMAWVGEEGSAQGVTAQTAGVEDDSAYLLGDSDCDDDVDSVDALMILRRVAGLADSSDCIERASDVDCDGDVDAIDALFILRHVAALAVEVPSGCTAIGDPAEPDASALTVDKFGGGAVTSLPAGLDCGQGCTFQSAQFASGSTVELTANPEPGWSLSHWSGCDSPSRSTCTVTVDEDTTVFVTFQSDEIVLSDQAELLTSETLDKLIDVDGATYVFDGGALQVAELAQGDVIIGTEGQGFLRKVMSIASSDGRILVETTDAGLDEAIQEGTIVFQKQLTPNDLLQTSTASGLVPQLEPLASFNQPIDVDLVPGVLALSGQSTFTVELDIAIDIGFSGINEIRFIMNFTNETELILTAEKSFSLPAEYTFEFPFACFPVAFVVLCPELDLNVGVRGSAQASMESTANLDASIQAGFRCYSLDDCHPVAQSQRNFGFQEPKLSASAQATAYLAPELQLLVLGIVGPYFNLEAYALLEANPFDSPWWRLYGGLSGSAGATLEIPIFSDFSYAVDLFGFQWLLAQASSPPSPTPILPDLTSSAVVGASYESGQAGVQIPVTVSRSGGNLTQGSYVHGKLYWSSDAAWDPGDQVLWSSNDSIPHFSNNALNASGSKTVTATIDVLSVSDGTYYIISYADAPTPSYPGGFYGESNEVNNTAVYAVQVSVGGGPPPTPTPPPPLARQGWWATVTAVVDGDTICVDLVGDPPPGAQKGEGCPTNWPVRLIGVDTPEDRPASDPPQCFAIEASAFLSDLVDGQIVWLERDPDQSVDGINRILAYLWRQASPAPGDLEMVNETIVRQGYGSEDHWFPSTGYITTVKYRDLLEAAEQEARSADRGLWGACLNVSLEASPSSGEAPLNGVDLTATVSGGATGPINYYFFCDRSDPGREPTDGAQGSFMSEPANPKTAVDLCSYPASGTYTAKVIVERGNARAEEARIEISVGVAPAPQISSISPVEVVAGTFDLTISGSGFVCPGAVDQVYWAATGNYIGQGTIQSCSESELVVTEHMDGAEAGFYLVKVKNPDGQLSNGADLTLLATPSLVNWVYETSSVPSSISLSDDGDYIAFGSSEGVHLLNGEGGLLWDYPSVLPIGDVSVTADASHIVAGGSQGSIIPAGIVYGLTNQGDLEWSIEPTGISSVSYSADGNYLAMTYVHGLGWNDVVALWGENEGEWLWNYTFGRHETAAVAVSADGQYIAVGGAAMGSGDSAVRLYDKAGNVLWEYAIDTAALAGDKYSVAISSDGKYIATGNEDDDQLYFFDRDQQLLWSYPTGPIQGVSISSDGDRISAASRDQIYVFDRGGNLLWGFEISNIEDVAMSQDAQTIVVVSEDNKIYSLNPPILSASGLAVNPLVLARTEAVLSPNFTCADGIEILKVDCEAVTALYESTDGSSWENNSRWLHIETPCTAGRPRATDICHLRIRR